MVAAKSDKADVASPCTDSVSDRPPPTPSLLVNSLLNVLSMLFNVAAVVGCIAFTKILFLPPYNFTYSNTIVSVHFLYTSLLGYFLQKANFSTAKAIPSIEYVKVSSAQVGAICFINLSLLLNSIGMYQVLKFSNIPVLCVIEFFWLGQVYPFWTYVALAGLLGGIYLTTVTDIWFVWKGFLCGLAGAVCGAVHQTVTKRLLTGYDVTPMQLLQPQMVYGGVLAGVAALLFDDVASLLRYPFFSGPFLWVFFLSCNSAFFVNFSCYLVIGRTTPVSYGVAGCLKTIGTLSFGYLLLRQPYTLRNMAGIFLSTFSALWYAQLCLKEASRAKAIAVTTIIQPCGNGSSSSSTTNGPSEQKHASGAPLIQRV